ncbi:MAG: 4-hydroxy-3-methylbut-2-enyl diphosphate reductase [Spirochaetales bacterium]|nr:4-hydroxy-3-methylbut-2-enyl diphosphate reductase [Candidatus Physcosoma equi]
MKVIKAEYLGFCTGVDLAIKTARAAVKEAEAQGRSLYFYGELVHNTYISEQFAKHGAVVIRSTEEAREPGVLVIRAHGITDAMRESFLKKGFEIIDTTCPVVLKGQRLVRESEEPVLVFGYPGHSEVISLLGSAKGECRLVSVPEDLDKLDKETRYRVVVQTTFSQKVLNNLLEKADKIGLKLTLANSICSASVMRRKGVSELKGKVEAFVVVGDKKSANTLELVETAKRLEVPVFFVDGVEKIPEEVFSFGSVGLTAGASTPAVLYDGVCRQLEEGPYVD